MSRARGSVAARCMPSIPANLSNTKIDWGNAIRNVACNILLDDKLEPTVGDFGYAKLMFIAKYDKWPVMTDRSYIDLAYIVVKSFTVLGNGYDLGRPRVTNPGLQSVVKENVA
ncbi:hypothetical protein ABZP36_008779 [Zizania latifolia]